MNVVKLVFEEHIYRINHKETSTITIWHETSLALYLPLMRSSEVAIALYLFAQPRFKPIGEGGISIHVIMYLICEHDVTKRYVISVFLHLYLSFSRYISHTCIHGSISGTKFSISFFVCISHIIFLRQGLNHTTLPQPLPFAPHNSWVDPIFFIGFHASEKGQSEKSLHCDTYFDNS